MNGEEKKDGESGKLLSLCCLCCCCHWVAKGELSEEEGEREERGDEENGE